MKSRKHSAEPGVAGELRVGERLRNLRLRSQASMRQVSERAGVAVSYLSGVEAGRVSPTIAMLRKLLLVLGSDLGTFFAPESTPVGGCVFRRESMRTVTDANRCYTFALPKRDDIPVEMLDEEWRPGETPEFETTDSALGGYVVSGEMLLEVQGEAPQRLRPGDAFFVPRGCPVRGRCAENAPVRVLTVFSPPRY